MKFKLSIFIFMLIFSALFVNVSCNVDGSPCGPETPPSPPEPDYLGEHFTNEIVTIPAKTTYNYYNSGKYKNKPEQERVTLYVRSDKDKTRLREVRGRRVIETPILDIYVDLSEYRGVVQKSVNFGLNNWIKLLNSFYDNYQKMIDVYGNHYKGFNGGKIDILFVDLMSFDGGGYIGGYFTSRDLEGHTYGNKRQILYINSRYLVEIDIDNLMHTIFHEFQHLINYSRVKLEISQSPMHTWLNEALSESTYPVILDDKHAWRSEDFIDSKNGQYFFDWDRNSPIIPANYNTAANFMYWLYIQSGGYHIIKDIVSVSKSKYKQIDHKSIEDAANRNIIQFVGKDYNTIIYNWYRANFYNKPSGILGYQNKATISLSLADEPSGKITLKPKCAVYTTQDMFDKNKNIPYIVVEKLYDKGKNWLLVFNSGSDNRTVYINPRVYFSMSEARSHSGEEKELELYDQVYYLDEYEHFEGEDLPPEEINE